MADTTRKDVADAQFKKLQKIEDGKKAMSEYESEQERIRANTARLRALRLARDAADDAARDAAPAAPAKKASRKTAAGKTKKPTGTLSAWLSEQQASGRRS